MRRGYVVVEGHGEVEAAKNLLNRVSDSRQLDLAWTQTARYPKLHLREGVTKAAEVARRRSDVDVFLLLRDSDDDCPRDDGPKLATWLHALQLPFPSAVVLFKPEYEVLFLPSVERMAGQPLREGSRSRPGLRPNAQWLGSDWEKRRGLKEWLTTQFDDDRSYKPTTDQLALTRLIDLAELRAANVPCYGTLERALQFLATAQPGTVYPPAQAPLDRGRT